MTEPSRREPTEITELLARVLENLQASPDARAGRLVASWSEIAGPRWAGCSVPIGIKDQVLLVEVASPTEAAVLRYETGSLLQRIDAALGEDLVAAIRLRVRRGTPESRR